MKFSSLPILAFCSFLLSCSCGSSALEPVCQAPVDAVLSISAPIIGGSPSTEHRGVVWLGHCSSIIVGKHTLLTAAHCPFPEHVETRIHEDYEFPYHDIQLVYPKASFAPPYAEVAEDVVYGCVGLVAQGYGIDSNGNVGILHEQQVWQTDRRDGLIKTTGATCGGDSGGALWAILDDGSYVLVGVVSFGETGCPSSLDNGYVDLTHPENREWLERNIR